MWATLIPNYPHYFFDYKFEVAHYNFQCEKVVWVLSSAYWDENWRQDKTRQDTIYKISDVKQSRFYKIHVGDIKFQPTWISHPR